MEIQSNFAPLGKQKSEKAWHFVLPYKSVTPFTRLLRQEMHKSF